MTSPCGIPKQASIQSTCLLPLPAPTLSPFPVLTARPSTTFRLPFVLLFEVFTLEEKFYINYLFVSGFFFLMRWLPLPSVVLQMTGFHSPSRQHSTVYQRHLSTHSAVSENPDSASCPRTMCVQLYLLHSTVHTSRCVPRSRVIGAHSDSMFSLLRKFCSDFSLWLY